MTRNFKMKRIDVFFLAILFVFNSQGIFAKSKTKYRAFSPTDAGKSVMLKSDSNKYKYFELESGKSIGFDVSGPAQVKIRTRAYLPENLLAGEYEVTVWEGSKVKTGRKAKTAVSKISIDGSKDRVGVARDILLKVPRGEHSYTLSMESGNISKFYVRFYQNLQKKKKTAYEAFQPYEFARREKLKSGKSSFSYYFVDDKGGAKLKVIGPTKIKIYCRANFDATLKEKSKFSLGVMENGKSVEIFAAVADKSSKGAYIEVRDVIPSTLHTFILEVPDGEHVYEFRKVNSLSANLAVRFGILRSSLGK